MSTASFSPLSATDPAALESALHSLAGAVPAGPEPGIRLVLEAAARALHAPDAGFWLKEAGDAPVCRIGERAESLRGEAVLEAPLAWLGEPLGRIRFARPAAPAWRPDERLFAAAVAERVVALLERVARAQAERALRERERQVAEVEAISRLGSWEWNVALDQLTWSDEQFRIYGLEPGSVRVGYGTWVGAIHADDRERVEASVQRSFRTGESFELSHRIVGPDGSLRWVACRGRVVTNSEGQTIRILGTCQDVTEQREAEERLRASEESYRAIFDSSNDAVFVHDLETGAILDANREACRANGVTLEELKTRGLGLIGNGPPPYTPDRALAHLRRAASGEPQRFEWMTLHPHTGEQMWVEVSLQRVTIRGEQRLLALVRDIRERKAADRALRESEESYRNVFQHSSDAIWLHELESGAFLDVNQAACAMFGYAVEEMKALGVEGVSWGEEPYTIDRAREFIERAVAGEPQRFEWLGRHKNGSPVWAEVRLRRVTIGGEDRLLATGREITDRKAAEEELRRAYAELERRVEERTAELAEANEALEEEIAEHEAAKEQLLERTRELEGIFQALPDLYFRLDADSIVLDYRAGHLDSLYVPPEAFLGRRIYDVLPPQVAEPYAAATAVVESTGELALLEYALPITGEERDYEARILPLGDGTKITLIRDITERKRAERALQEREEHFRKLIENANDIITILEPDGTIRYQSPALSRLLGYEPDSLNGRNVFELVHPEDVELVLPAFRAAIETPGTSHTVTYRFLHADGSWRVLDSVGRTLAPDSASEGVVANTRDVTERRQAEEALRFQTTLLEAQNDAAIDGILVADGGKVLSMNQRYAELFHVPQELRTPDRCQEMFRWACAQAADPAAYRARIEELRADPDAVNRDEVLLADGRVLDRYTAPIRSAEGRRYGRIWVVRDITERKQTEAALRFQSTLLEAQNHAAIDGIMVTNEGRVLSMNQRYAELFNVPEELRAPGRTIDLLRWTRTQAADPAAYRARIEELRADDDAVGRDEVPLVDGRVLDRYTAPLVSADGRRYGRIWVIRDITDRKRTEAALRQAKDEAERANRAKSEFLSRMSHELRTPMNSILGFAQLLGRAELPPQQAKSVQHILKAGRHLLNLINEVLEIARIEAGRQNFSLEPVRLGSVLQEAVGLVRPLASQWGVEVEEASGVHGAAFVRADRQRLVQVLLNLLANAIKYNRSGGQVRVSCAPAGAGGRMVVRVEDTGRGIPIDRVDQLFTPFARLGAEQTEVEGTGLGLALSQRLCEAMGGSLTLESTGPQGSVFRVELAAAEDPVSGLDDAAAPASGPGVSSHRDATILYIEDNLANLSLVETILLSRPRWRTIPALQGQLGVELAREHLPDLILLDLHLPDITGEEVLRRLRADDRTARIPVVVISADATRGSVDRLRGAGVDAYLTKPLDVDEFVGTLEDFLGGERS